MIDQSVRRFRSEEPVACSSVSFQAVFSSSNQTIFSSSNQASFSSQVEPIASTSHHREPIPSPSGHSTIGCRVTNSSSIVSITPSVGYKYNPIIVNCDHVMRSSTLVSVSCAV